MGIKIYTIFTLLMVALLVGNSSAIVNNRVTRVFDMNGPNTKQVTSIEIANDGDEEISQYILLVHNQHLKSLIHIQAKIKDDTFEVDRHIDGDVSNPYLQQINRFLSWNSMVLIRYFDR
jgi:hypothetical protein